MSTNTTVTGGTLLEEIAAAHRIAADTGADWRTVLRALRLGVDVIRTIKVREAIRPHVAAHRALAKAPASAAEARRLSGLDEVLAPGGTRP